LPHALTALPLRGADASLCPQRPLRRAPGRCRCAPRVARGRATPGAWLCAQLCALRATAHASAARAARPSRRSLRAGRRLPQPRACAAAARRKARRCVACARAAAFLSLTRAPPAQPPPAPRRAALAAAAALPALHAAVRLCSPCTAQAACFTRARPTPRHPLGCARCHRPAGDAGRRQRAEQREGRGCGAPLPRPLAPLQRSAAQGPTLFAAYARTPHARPGGRSCCWCSSSSCRAPRARA
jgi:hypothetical protein